MNPAHPLMKICNVDPELIKQYHLNKPSSHHRATEPAFEAIRITADLPPQPLDIAIDVPSQQRDKMLEQAYHVFKRGDSLHDEIFPLIESCGNDNIKVQLYIYLTGYLACWGADQDQVLEVMHRIPSDFTLSFRKTNAKEFFSGLNIPYEPLHRNARADALIDSIVYLMIERLETKSMKPLLEILINLLPDTETKDRLQEELVRIS